MYHYFFNDKEHLFKSHRQVGFLRGGSQRIHNRGLNPSKMDALPFQNFWALTH